MREGLYITFNCANLNFLYKSHCLGILHSNIRVQCTLAYIHTHYEGSAVGENPLRPVD